MYQKRLEKAMCYAIFTPCDRTKISSTSKQSLHYSLSCHTHSLRQPPLPHLDSKTRPRGKGSDPDLAGDVSGHAPAQSISFALHHPGAGRLGYVEV